MFKRFIIAALGAASLFAIIAQADSKQFQWDYGSTSITGFKLYCGVATKAYAPTPVATVNATTKTATVSFAPATSQFCAVTAYDTKGESAPSNEVTFYSPPDAPSNFRIVISAAWGPDGRVHFAIEQIEGFPLASSQ